MKKKKLSFSYQVYQLVKKVPPGKVVTYKQIAQALKSKAYRAVGQALKRNPNPLKIPCHRVIASNGTIGGFKGQKQGKAVQKKMELLKKEGIKFEGKKITDLTKVLYFFR